MQQEEPMKTSEELEDEVRWISRSWSHIETGIDSILIKLGKSNYAKVHSADENDPDILTEEQELKLLKKLSLYSALEHQGRLRNSEAAKKYWASKLSPKKLGYVNYDLYNPDDLFGIKHKLKVAIQTLFYILVTGASVSIIYSIWFK